MGEDQRVTPSEDDHRVQRSGGVPKAASDLTLMGVAKFILRAGLDLRSLDTQGCAKFQARAA